MNMTEKTANVVLVLSVISLMSGVILLYKTFTEIDRPTTLERSRADSGSVVYTIDPDDLVGEVPYVLDPGDRLLSIQDSVGEELCAIVLMPDGGAEIIGKFVGRCIETWSTRKKGD